MKLDPKGVQAAQSIWAGRLFEPSAENIEEAILAYLSATDSVIVPVEPTNKMLDAASAAMSPGKRPTQKYVSCKKKHAIRYAAMIQSI